MPTRRALRAMLGLATLLLVTGPSAAFAQPVPPPPVDEVEFGRFWAFSDVAPFLVGFAVLVVLGSGLGYLVKARSFRANVRRGGTK